MLKVIIADDERIQREGIAKHVKWPSYQMEVVGLAEDGEQALALIEKNGVDLLITDIKMPKMYGLELAERAKLLNPQLKILIISGYDDFEYARAAIELKAYAFLLKPISIDKLSQEIGKIYAQIVQEQLKQQTLSTLQDQLRESKPLLVEKLFHHMLYGFVSGEEIIRNRMKALSVPVPEHGYDVMLLHIDDSGDRLQADVEKQLLFLQFIGRLSASVLTERQGQALQTKDHEFAIVRYASEQESKQEPDQESTQENPAAVPDLIRKIREELLLPFKDGLTICISNRKYALSQLNEAYKECEAALLQKFYLGKGKDIYYRDSLPEQPLSVHYDGHYERMIQAVEIGNATQAEQSVAEMFTAFSNKTAVDQSLIKAFCFRIVSDMFRIIHGANEKIEAVFGDEHRLWDRIYHFDTLPEIHAWLKDVVLSTCRHIHAKRTRKNTGIVESIIHVIETRYQEPITIDELAKHVHLTPNYISNIFREHVGESIIDYLTKVRMKHAVRLLADESVRIYEVAEQTGYNSTSYFSVVFKGMYGISPKEYRDSASKLQKDGTTCE